jgi:hypothetical protein
MTKQHTPGPWSLEAVKDYLRHEDTGIDTGHPEALANARLIAAAPELMEELRNLAQGLADYVNDSEAELPDTFRAWDIIAKAEGREP